MSKAKPTLTIGTIGGTGHGKSTLTSAITKVLARASSGSLTAILSSTFLYSSGHAKYVPPERLNRDLVDRVTSTGGVSVNRATVKYETANRIFEHVDCPDESDYIKGMISGATHLNNAILVLSSSHADSPSHDNTTSPITDAATKYISLARQTGTQKLIVFINKTDLLPPSTPESPSASADLLAEQEAHVRTILGNYGYDAKGTPVIKGSALQAVRGQGGKDDIWEKKILALLQCCDTWFERPIRSIDKPFLMSINDIIPTSSKSFIATGRVERGIVHTGQEVDIIPSGESGSDTLLGSVTGVEMFRRLMDEAHAGDKIGLLIRGVKAENVEKGMVLAKPFSVSVAKKFRALVYILSESEGGRSYSNTLPKDWQPHIQLRQSSIKGTIVPAPAVESVTAAGPITKEARAGDHIEVICDLEKAGVVEVGLRFTIHDGDVSLGCGVISKIIQ